MLLAEDLLLLVTDDASGPTRSSTTNTFKAPAAEAPNAGPPHARSIAPRTTQRPASAGQHTPASRPRLVLCPAQPLGPSHTWPMARTSCSFQDHGPDSVRHRRASSHFGPDSVRQLGSACLTESGPPQVSALGPGPHSLRRDSGFSLKISFFSSSVASLLTQTSTLRSPRSGVL